MALALLTFGVAFGAFCVWLTVRIVNRREGWAKWTGVAIATLAAAIAYPFCAGYFLWLAQSKLIPSGHIYLPTYRPFRWLIDGYDGWTPIFWPPRHEGGELLLTGAIVAPLYLAAFAWLVTFAIKKRRIPSLATGVAVLWMALYTVAIREAVFFWAMIDAIGRA